jgi:hypothetical protein
VTSPERAGRDALLAFAITAVLVAALVRIDVTLPYVGHLGSALVAVLFLYVPVYFVWRRKEELDHYGFHAAPVGRGLGVFAVALAVMIPLFVFAYFAFYELVCSSPELRPLMEGQCNGYLNHGLDRIHAPAVSLFSTKTNSTLALEWCLVQLAVVALPEELFFRGFLLGLLEKRFPPKRHLLGGGIGLALVLSALAFALVHFPKNGDPRDLATFFPALMFGWMRSMTGSIFASTLTHASANILVRALDLMALR